MKSLSNSFQLNLLNIERCTLDEKWNYVDVRSPFFRMFYILNGKGHITTDHEEFDLVPGNLYLIPNYINCSYSCDKHLEMIYIIFVDLFNEDTGINHFYDLKFRVQEQTIDIKLFFRLLELNPDRALLDYDPKNYDNWQYLDKLVHIEKGDTIQNFTETRGILLHLFSRFMISGKSNLHIENKSHITILESIQYINENLDGNLNLDILSEKAFLSSDYYSRLFLKITKCRPIEYIQRKRVEKAHLLLATTYLSLENIAEQTGINSVSYLSRLFKRYTGLSPSKYRKERFI